MHTRFTTITNELNSLGEIIPINKLVSKFLSVLSASQLSKVNEISEAWDLESLSIDYLIGKLKTYELKKHQDHEMDEPRKDKNLVLKATEMI